QPRAGLADVGADAVVDLRGVALYALVVEAVDHLADVLRPALDDRAVLVLIAKHQAVIAAGELLQARAHALSRRASDEHLFHQPVDLLRRERHEPGRRLLTLAALAHLGV